MISQKAYLIRGLYEWCADNDFTPYLATFVDNNTHVPMQFVQNNQIVLNIAFNAIKDLVVANDWVTFKAAFNGKAMDLSIPTANVVAIFAKENGQGMQFEVENYQLSLQEDPDKKPFSGLKLLK